MVHSNTEYKVEKLVKSCIYLIATGKWLAGEKLPSIRQAEERWDANRITINKAYKKLEESGYVVCKPKSGYYVASHSAIRGMVRFRNELDSLYREFKEKIISQTDLSSLGVFKYLMEKSLIESRENPEVAFIECTHSQAEGHCQEIYQQLGVPVLPLSLNDLEGKSSRIPAGVRVVLTSVFHIEEVRELLQGSRLRPYPIQIEVSPELRDKVSKERGRAVFLEREEDMARCIGEDTRKLLGDADISIEVVASIEGYLKENCDNPTGENLFLLSPRLWGSMELSWRKKKNIRQVTFSIAPQAWESVAEAIGLPLVV